MGASNAVQSGRVEKIVGYELLKGNFQNVTPNLPMRIAIFGQANTANQASITNDPFEFFSEKEVGDKYGYGSQLHIMARILRAKLVDRVGGVPTVIYPQLAPGGGVAEVQTITVTGAATGNATHIVRINGRSNFDGASLEISIADGDAVADVASAIADAINAASSCPVSASPAAGVVTLTMKWVGENGSELDVQVDNQDAAVGLSYAVAQTVAGAGDSSAEITSSLALFGNTWNTIVISPYPATRDALFETVNGVPGVSPATGRYSGEIFKPFIVLRGDKQSDTVSNITSALDKDQATIVQCPAPASDGWNAEAAANVCALLAGQAQNDPHLDTADKAYPDMPVPLDGMTGVYDNYNSRDAIVKAGGSTVILNNGKYEIQSLITTYHPDNENPPKFRYVRTLIQDWNVRYGYLLLEGVNLINSAIVENDTIVTVSKTIKPKQWRAILRSYFISLQERALITDPDFSLESLIVEISDENPDRLNTFFRYRRTGFSRISSTTAEADFTYNIQ